MVKTVVNHTDYVLTVAIHTDSGQTRASLLSRIDRTVDRL